MLRLHGLVEKMLDCSHVPSPLMLHPPQKMTGLAEQAALAVTQEKTGESAIYGRKGRRLKSSTGVSLGHAERKLERQKPIWNSGWPLL